MSFFTPTTSSSSGSTTIGTMEKDVPLGDFNDTPSDISFASVNLPDRRVADIMAVTSWDNAVRVFEVSSDVSGVQRLSYNHDNAVLSCDFTSDGTKLVSGGCDKVVKAFDLESGQSVNIGQHDLTVRSVRWVQTQGNAPLVVSGSWDKKLKYWDLRQQNSCGEIVCQDRVFSMDTRNNLLVIATAERYINSVNLQDPFKFYNTMQSPLKYQTRVVRCIPDGSGYAIGSIEGRCAFQYNTDTSSNFSFKCHRDPPNADNKTNVYAVNDISFHMQHGTFSTVGSDGTFNFWDKVAKHRLRGYQPCGSEIVASKFNPGGTIFAYTVGYDWSKGYMANTPEHVNKVMLHLITGDECKPRGPKKK